MIKIFIVFLSILAIAFYFLRDQTVPGSEARNKINDRFETIAQLPSAVEESSGIVIMPDQETYLTHNDAGNKPYLYEINKEGELVKTHEFNLPNVDWEDLSRDDQGNLYIGDIGNNNNQRKELAIYKVNLKDTQKPAAIRFTYEDQEANTSKKDKNSFDSEAMFWSGSNLYLVTKDRNGSKEAKVYRLTDQPGTQEAHKIGTIKMKEPVTGAAISPDASTIALLSEEKIHLYRNVSNPEQFFEGEALEIDIKGAGQTEGITFEDDKTLILTSEGGSLYRYSL